MGGPRWETPDPPGVAGTYGDQVIRWMGSRLGIKMGPWQRHVTRKILRYDKRGDLIHRNALISTGRQNGKSIVVRGIFGWLVDCGRKMDGTPFSSWSEAFFAATDGKQAGKIYKQFFGDMVKLYPKPARKYGERMEPREVEPTRWLGTQAGELFVNTVTGEPGSARGDATGMLAWDEVLTQKSWDLWAALSPTQSAQRSPIMLLTSTAGHEDSVVLRAFYDRLRRQATGDEAPDPTFYGAWWESEDEDAGLDWKQIKMANPALGDGRLTRQAIAAEHAILPSDSWRRERLNHFVDVRADGAFSPGTWARCRAERALDGLAGPYALGVDVQPGWQRATVSVAGLRPDGRVGLDVYRDLRSLGEDRITAERITAEIAAFPDMEHVLEIVYDGISGIAPELRRHAAETGLPYRELNRKDYVAACMDVAELIHSARLAVDDPLIDAQVGVVARRDVGSDGMFCFSRGLSLGAIDAFLSMTFAVHAIASTGPQPRIT